VTDVSALDDQGVSRMPNVSLCPATEIDWDLLQQSIKRADASGKSIQLRVLRVNPARLFMNVMDS